jgi:hypothetical protein
LNGKAAVSGQRQPTPAIRHRRLRKPGSLSSKRRSPSSEDSILGPDKMEVIHNKHQQLAIGITSALLFLTTMIVAIRLYIRCILLKAGSTGWDDLTVFIAWVGFQRPGST